MIREKVPLLVLALASAVVTLLVQRAGGALGPLAEVPLGPRLVHALRALGLYLSKSLVPEGLCVIHPHPYLAGGGGWTVAAALGLGLLLAWLVLGWRRRRSAPVLLVGALWFVGLLVPVLGLVQVGLQGWAERYTYLPSVGLALALVWGGAELLGPRGRAPGLVLALAALSALAWRSARQAETWRDSRTLFAHAMAVEESAVAHTNLGLALEAAGELAQAERHHARASELAPAMAGPRLNRARVLGALGRRSEAEAELAAAVAAEPELAEAHAQLGWLWVEEGRDGEALPHLRRAHELAPEQLPIANNLAWVLATSATVADAEAARALAERLVTASREKQAAHLETLAAALARLGRFEEAVSWQLRALERVPATARGPLAERLALYRSGRPYVRGR